MAKQKFRTILRVVGLTFYFSLLFYVIAYPFQFTWLNMNPTLLNFKPFRYLKYEFAYHFKIAVMYSLGNVLLFVPLGFIMMVKGQKGIKKFFKVTIFGFLISLSVETFQFLFTTSRSADVDDLIFNTTGSFLGVLTYAIMRGIKNMMIKVHTKKQKEKNTEKQEN